MYLVNIFLIKKKKKKKTWIITKRISIIIHLCLFCNLICTSKINFISYENINSAIDAMPKLK